MEIEGTFGRTQTSESGSIDEDHSTDLAAAQGGPGWLDGSSALLRRLWKQATAVASTPCRVILVTGPPGIGKRHVGRWLLSRRVGPRTAVLELDAAHVDPSVSRVASPILLSHAERLGGPSLQRLKNVLARRAPTNPAVVTSTIPVAKLRERSMEHEQLFGRITDAVLDVRPLCERPEDAVAIAVAMLQDAVLRHDSIVRGLSPDALEQLTTHPLTGNAREIEALIERAVLRAQGDWLRAEDLFPEGSRTDEKGSELMIRLPGSSLREIEIKALTTALRLTGGRIVRAAELLGITRHAMRRKLEKFGIESRQFTHNNEIDPNAFI